MPDQSERQAVPGEIRAYFSRNPLTHKLETGSDITSGDKFRASIVIPVLNELETLPQTLDSLLYSLNNFFPDNYFSYQIIIVVNNPPLPDKHTPEFQLERERFLNNQSLLKLLRNNSFQISSNLPLGHENFSLCWIDASSEGYEIDRKQGVGGARKVGMDIALHHLDWEHDPLIFSLDADTLVKDNYFRTVRKFFDQHPAISGATVDFLHLPGADGEEEKAIRLYETYLRHYVAGLQATGSPYCYYPIGSTMVFRGAAYVKAGGMRPKTAGEDFYFLQALCKAGQTQAKFPISQITGTCVYPSSRISNRVPFGTGPKIKEYIDLMHQNNGKVDNKILFNPRIFQIIKQIIDRVENGTLVESFDKWFIDLPGEAKDFFAEQDFRKTWAKIVQNTPKDLNKTIMAFHTWFDAFRILKFIHFCEKSPYCLEKVCPYN